MTIDHRKLVTLTNYNSPYVEYITSKDGYQVTDTVTRYTKPVFLINNLFGDATLDLNFAADKSIGNLITFSRASTGTYVDSDGLIKTAVADAPRFDHDPVTGESLGLLIEEGRTNLVDNSNDAGSLDTGGGPFTVSDTNEVTSPTGSGTVIKLDKTGVGYGFARTGYTLNQDTQTFSVFVKKGTARYVGLRLRSGADYTTFDLNTNSWVVTTGSISRGYHEYPNGWIRLWIVNDVDNNYTSVAIVESGGGTTNSNAATGTLFAFGYQREAGSFPTSYIPTTGSAVTRAADIASIEGNKFAKTNLLTYSERFDQSVWSGNVGTSITPNVALSPDNEITADRIKLDTGFNYCYQGYTFSAQTYTFSVYLKSNTSSDQSAIVRLYDGSTTFPESVTVTNQWQRFTVTASLSSGTGNVLISKPDGNTLDILAWGAQLETGELTEYTPSVESFVSRASTATYVDDATGLIKTTPVNLLRYSKDFTNWTGSSLTSVNSTIKAPDGTFTARYIDASSTTSALAYLNAGVTNSTVKSMYVRTVSGTATVRILQDYRVAPLTTITEEWQRFEVQGNSSELNGGNFYAIDFRGTGYTATDVLIWGAQLEEGTTATPYIKTGSTISGAARYENGELLLEEARTNLAKYSEPDDRSTDGVSGEWTFSDLNPNTEITKVEGPNGVSNSASKMQLATGNGPDAYLRRVPVTSGASYTFSAWVKLGTATNLALHVNNAAANNSVPDGTYSFDVNDGLNTNTFVKVSHTFTAPSTGIVNAHIGRHLGTAPVQQTQGTVTVWGCQLELGAFSSSTIITSGSTVTRAADIASIEGNKFAKTNLLSYSERFDQWTAGTNTTVTPNYETAPDGTLTADRLQFANSAGTFLSNTAATSGTQYTFSVYIKASASSVSAGTNQIILKVGSVPETVTATTEWQRVAKTITASNTNSALFDNLGVSDVSIWGAQLETGELTEYTPSVESFDSRASTATYVDDATGLITTAAVATARYENGELLLEEARTNIIARNTSNYNSIWSNAVPSGAYNNAGIAPDGTNTAFATTAYAPVGRGQKNYSMTADTNDYTFSIFIKSTGGQGQYRTYSTGFNGGARDNINQVAYDFATDTVGSGYSRKLYANGWVRIWKTYTNTNKTLFLATNNGTTSLDILFWGAQIEKGSYPSSLIITSDGGGVTRAADVSTSALGVDTWYNQSEGTVFADADNEGGRIVVISDGSNSNRISLFCNSTITTLFQNNSGVTEANLNLPKSSEVAFSYALNNYALCAGEIITADTSATPLTVNRMNIGSLYTGAASYLNGHITRLAYFPTRKTDQELIDLTKP